MTGTRAVLPPHAIGQRIGLYGGSFNPPHTAHRAVALLALKRLKLDAVWLLVTPGNPLKSGAGLAPLGERMSRLKGLVGHPRLKVTDLEARFGTHYTADTIAAVTARAPSVTFVWVMGADNLAQFHRWQDWRGIARRVSLAVVDRPGSSLKAAASPAARALARARLSEGRAATLARRAPPAWVFLHGLKSPLSSTSLRQLERSA